ncbi:MAG: uracil-DNA glycosylase family 4 [Verrucomicrobiales bacterium]
MKQGCGGSQKRFLKIPPSLDECCCGAKTSVVETNSIDNRKSAAALLLRHLQAEREHGKRQVWLSPESLQALNVLPQVFRETQSGLGDHAAEIPAPGKKEKALKLRAVREAIEADQELSGMDSLRDTMVFAVGNADADMMFVGEAPGAEEEKQREPFVGPAGELLNKIITAMGLSRDKVYISNIVKFRPKVPNQTTQNRKPTADEMAPFRPYLSQEVEIVEPKVIVALGGTAAEGLLEYEGSVGAARGRTHDFRGIPTLVTYHPSYLLRNPALSERRKLWEDCMKAMEIIGMPVSEKQRTFFLPK